MRKFLFAFIILINMFFLTACSTQIDPYHNAQMEAEQLEQAGSLYGQEYEKLSLKEKTITNSYIILDYLKVILPYVVIGSITLGVLILLLIKKDAEIRKKAIFVFITGIPIGYFIIVHVLAAIVGGFLP